MTCISLKELNKILSQKDTHEKNKYFDFPLILNLSIFATSKVFFLLITSQYCTSILEKIDSLKS